MELLGFPRGLKVKWKIPLIICLFYILLFIPKVYADLTIIQTVNNFNFIVYQDQTITFQHPTISLVVDDFHINLTCTNGGFNASDANLQMYQVTGILRFTSLNTTSFIVGRSREGVNVRINGVKYFNGTQTITTSQTVIIEWGAQGADFILLSMGILGLGIIICTPVVSIYKIKKEKEYIWIVYSLCLLTVGGAFVSSWIGAI